MAVRSGAIELRDDFIWLREQRISRVRQPDWENETTFRPIGHIAPKELDLAIDNLLEMAGGSYDNLMVDVSRVLGFDRVGARILMAPLQSTGSG